MLSHDIVMGTMRPGRYIGHEWNVVRKDFSKMQLRFCLCFPDVYDVAMSHLGTRILYDVINAQRGVVCERAFCPWPDFGKALSANALELCSLESEVPLRLFDIVGFSVNNELNYTNILSMLSLSKIPLRASKRGDGSPLVIAGGNCALNPEPLAEFFDLFVIGEAEELIVKIIAVCNAFKRKHTSLGREKEALLYALSQLQGVYVPAFYRVQYSDNRSVKEFVPLKKNLPASIKKVWVKDLNKNMRPRSWMVPNIAVIHDRIGIEIMRGCAHQCRFCQARSHFFPLRIRSARKVVALAKRLYKTSGYEDVSLLSLSSSDHPHIEKIASELVRYFRKEAVSISFSSMRAKNSFAYISSLLASLRKTGLTFAPEAGSQRLRNVINKTIDIDDLFAVAQTAFKSGYQRIKLYFMIALPTEQQTDLDGIVRLAYELSMERKKVSHRAAEINMSISTFIPKPHTPFQWATMAGEKEIREKQDYLRQAARRMSRNLCVSFHRPEMSLLEATLSRGNRDMAKVIYDAFHMGAQFDQWDEWFNYQAWQDAFRKNGLELENCATSAFDIGSVLPWDFIDTGIPKEYLKEEFQKSLACEQI